MPPAKGRPRGRRAGLTLRKRQELRAQEDAARAKARIEREAGFAVKRAEREALAVARAAKAAAAQEAVARERAEGLAALERERDALLESRRPASVIEYCRVYGLPPNTPYNERYSVVGVDPKSRNEQALELICFGKDWPSEYGGLGAYGHLRKFIAFTWPDIVWNEWLERAMHSLCDSEHEHRVGNTRMRFVNWVGAGSAGKTFAAGVFACAWFMYDKACGWAPRSSVTLTSTSKGIIAQRVWPVIQRCYHEARHHPSGEKFKWGHMIDSQRIVQAVKGDAKHSIWALAVETGDLQKCLDAIKGRHTERMMVIIDEANSTPQAIFEAFPNIMTGVRELIVLVIGNAGLRLDPHGRCCEPKRGWKSITIDDDQWETKGVEQWSLGSGVCLHFDGARSPNVLAGRTDHKHIYSFERWQQVLRMGDEYRNTLQHWSQDRGFWAPDGISTTVFSEAMVISHDGAGKFDWLSTPEPYAALDPAFGGDNCVLQFGLVGDVRGPRKAIQLTDQQLVPFNPDSPDAIDYQIAVYVRDKCKARGVKPEHFGTDATGIGRGVAAFLQQLWSTRIHKVEFGGNASDLPASAEDPRASCDVYANRVTELWYVCKDFLLADQLKGLYPEAIKDFISRVYEFASRRYRVETKTDMKKRLGHSPDYGDAVAVLVDVARLNGVGVKAGAGARGVPREDAWQAAASEVASLASGDYGEAATFAAYSETD